MGFCVIWDFDFTDHKNIGDWQALFGINLRCPHLSWYTMEGEAKRDYPASILHQTPWYKDYNDIDGLVTNERNIGIITAHADCTPVQFYDPVHKVIGVAHSGWSGTLKNISGNMVKLMTTTYNSNPEDILVFIGPSLCQDCFEVDVDVKEQFLASNEAYIDYMYDINEKSYIDLRRIIEHELLQEGIKEYNIECSTLCTKCNPDIFYSHRVMGTKRGVFASAMILK